LGTIGIVKTNLNVSKDKRTVKL